MSITAVPILLPSLGSALIFAQGPFRARAYPSEWAPDPLGQELDWSWGVLAPQKIKIYPPFRFRYQWTGGDAEVGEVGECERLPAVNKA